MLRLTVFYAILVFLPLGLWTAGRRLLSRPKREAPWPFLLLTGVLLALGSMAILSAGDGAPAGAGYEPPRMNNGTIRPGRLSLPESGNE